MLIHILRRAKELVIKGEILFASPSLMFFLKNSISEQDFKTNPLVLNTFAKLDDFDITSAIKVWQDSNDKILSILSKKLINRELFKIEVSKTKFSKERIKKEKELIRKKYELKENEVDYFVYSETLTNNAYNQNTQNINLILKNGEIMDVSIASDNYNISALSSSVEKFYLCYPV